MSRRSLLICGLLIAAAAIAVLWSRESHEHARIVDAWMAGANESLSEEETELRLKRVVEIGPRAVPMLPIAKSPNSSLRTWSKPLRGHACCRPPNRLVDYGRGELSLTVSV